MYQKTLLADCAVHQWAKLDTIINACLSKMSDVSDCVSLSELKQVKYNVIYRDYKESSEHG